MKRRNVLFPFLSKRGKRRRQKNLKRNFERIYEIIFEYCKSTLLSPRSGPNRVSLRGNQTPIPPQTFTPSRGEPPVTVGREIVAGGTNSHFKGRFTNRTLLSRRRVPFDRSLLGTGLKSRGTKKDMVLDLITTKTLN